MGKRLYEGVSKQAWADWMKHQTMLVNENRLNLADQRAREYLKRQMEKALLRRRRRRRPGLRAPHPRRRRLSALAHARHVFLGGNACPAAGDSTRSSRCSTPASARA